MVDKVESILGFAVRARKLIYGIDNVESFRKRRYMIMICNTLSDRSKKRCLELAEKQHIPLIAVKHVTLENLIHKTKCKVIALTDRQMSQAIGKYLNDNYEVITSEVK